MTDNAHNTAQCDELKPFAYIADMLNYVLGWDDVDQRLLCRLSDSGKFPRYVRLRPRGPAMFPARACRRWADAKLAEAGINQVSNDAIPCLDWRQDELIEGDVHPRFSLKAPDHNDD